MRNIIYPIIVLMLWSCHNNGNTISIDLNRNDKVAIFDLVDSISVVKLETNPECLIKRMNQIIYHKNRFYIFDKSLYSIFCFDYSGTYLFKINKQGRGPDEYVNCEFVNIDKFNDKIMMLVPWGYLLYFDLDGNFISKVRLPEEIRNYNEVYSINDDVLLFLSINEYRAAYHSRSSNKILKRFLNCSPELVTVMLPIKKTYNYNDSIFFNDNIYNTVINLSDTTNPVKYSWNFGDNNNTNEKLMEFYLYREEQQRQKKIVNLEEALKNKNYIKHYSSYSIESKKYRGMSVRYGGFNKYVFYNKENNQCSVFNETIEGVKPYMYLIYDNSIVNYYSDKNDTILNKILTDKQLKIIESHNPDTDNPFLVIYHLK